MESVPKKKRSGVLAICFIIIGVSGLILSITGFPTLPSSFHSSPWMKYISWFTSGTCPTSIQSARNFISQTSVGSLASYFFPSTSNKEVDNNRNSRSNSNSGDVGPRIDPISGLRIYTLKELAKYDGSDETLSPPLLLAIWGDVFDVSVLGKDFYAPGKTYSCFGGKDGTRALTLGSLDKADVNNLDVSDFDANFFKMMIDQHSFYANKYPRVGVLADGTKANYRGLQKEADVATVSESATVTTPKEEETKTKEESGEM